MIRKIEEGKDNWYERDADAWLAAAMKLKEAGWTQKPNSYRDAVFCKDGETVALVRHLGQLNWHPVGVNLSK